MEETEESLTSSNAVYEVSSGKGRGSWESSDWAVSGGLHGGGDLCIGPHKVNGLSSWR